jgi:hypothetical protein
MERIGHLVSWLALFSVPICSVLSVARWLPQPFGDLGTIADVFLIILAAVFLHGISQAAREPPT